jgi:hypothetical protein
MISKLAAIWRQSAKFPREIADRWMPFAAFVSQIRTRRSGSAYGSGARSVACRTE